MEGEGDRSRSRSRDRERSRSRDHHDGQDAASDGQNQPVLLNGNKQHDGGTNNNPAENQGNNLYITNLHFKTTDESLRAAFEKFGEISNASVVREPGTQQSRGFGFVSFVLRDDSEKACTEMNGGDVDGRVIRVEKARRGSAYDKTPGKYLGPPQVSSKYSREREPRRGGGGGYEPRGGGGYEPRGSGYDRDPRPDRGDSGYGGSRGGGGYERSAAPLPYRGGVGGGGGYDRELPRYRDAPLPRYAERSRSPPRSYQPSYYDERSSRGGPAPAYAPPSYRDDPYYRREDVRLGSRGAPLDRGAPYGGSAYGGYDSRGAPPPRGGGRY